MVNSQYLTLDSQFHQVETAGDVACRRCLQEESDADGEGDHGDGDLSALDPAGEEQARDGSGDHTRLPTPANKRDLFSRPSAAPVGQKARQNGYGTGHEDEHEHHHEPAEEVLAERLEGQVEPERDEDEQGGYLGNLSQEPFEERGVFIVVAEPQHLHVPDHQPHDEGWQIGRSAERFGREVSERDDDGRQEYAGQDEQAEAHSGPGDHLQRDAGAAVEQDESYTYVEQE